MKKLVCEMTNEEKKRHVEVVGTIVQMLEERYRTQQIAERLKLYPWQVEENIDEILYQLRKAIGLKRFIKSIFIK